MKPTIREATEADLPQLVALLAQLAPDIPDREDVSSPLPYEYHLMLRRILEMPGQHVFVLVERKKIVGSLALAPSRPTSRTRRLRGRSSKI